MAGNQQGSGTIPRWVLYSEELSTHAKLVYVVLDSYVDEYAECFPSHATIARDGSMSIATVKRAILELTAFGVLTFGTRTRSNRSKTTNRYRLVRVRPGDNPGDSSVDNTAP